MYRGSLKYTTLGSCYTNVQACYDCLKTEIVFTWIDPTTVKFYYGQFDFDLQLYVIIVYIYPILSIHENSVNFR
jgi:hypothetical protein